MRRKINDISEAGSASIFRSNGERKWGKLPWRGCHGFLDWEDWHFPKCKYIYYDHICTILRIIHVWIKPIWGFRRRKL